MEHEAPAIFVALEASGFALGIRKSLWLYPAANIGHIVSLVFFVGAVAVMDVRLLGGFAETPAGRVLARARLWAIVAFIGMMTTGAMLFAAEASHLVVNPVYLVKLGLIGAGHIGSQIARLAVANGYNVVVYDTGSGHCLEACVTVYRDRYITVATRGRSSITTPP